MFIPPLSIGSLDLNMRFIYVALLALVMVFSALLRVYYINKHGGPGEPVHGSCRLSEGYDGQTDYAI